MLHQSPCGRIDRFIGLLESPFAFRSGSGTSDVTKLDERPAPRVLVVDRDDRIRFVNSRAAASVGRSAEELVGALRSDLFGRRTTTPMRSGLQWVFETGEPVEVDVDAYPHHPVHGVHLGQGDESLASARSRYPKLSFFGLSTHNEAQAAEAQPPAAKTRLYRLDYFSYRQGGQATRLHQFLASQTPLFTSPKACSAVIDLLHLYLARRFADTVMAQVER